MKHNERDGYGCVTNPKGEKQWGGGKIISILSKNKGEGEEVCESLDDHPRWGGETTKTGNLEERSGRKDEEVVS